MRVVVATYNAGKLEELRELLPSGLRLVSLSDVGLESPDETGASFEENALIKARAAASAGDAAIADDSGL
ncbi:MAG: non-canonical purine NTP pyrophosphatase, partial [Thermomicrobiales bacterium]